MNDQLVATTSTHSSIPLDPRVEVVAQFDAGSFWSEANESERARWRRWATRLLATADAVDPLRQPTAAPTQLDPDYHWENGVKVYHTWEAFYDV